MRKLFRVLFVSTLLSATLVFFLSADDQIPIETGSPLSSDLVLSGDTRVSREFRLTVPPDAVELTISVTESPVPLQVLVRTGGGSILSVHDSGQSAGSHRLHRLGTPALPTGPLLIEVSHQPDSSSVRTSPTRIPFVIDTRIARLELASVVRPGQSVSGTLEPGRGMVSVHAIDVPATAEVLRFDVAGAAGTIDLFAFYEDLRGDLRTADHRAVSPLGQESLVIGGSSGRVLIPGRWYVVVTDQTARRFVDSFELFVRFDADPPAELRAIPDIPSGRTGLQGVLDATAQVITSQGSGSAVFIGENGYLLTNDHVVSGPGIGGTGLPVIAMTLDRGVPPRELFRAIIVDRDPLRDLALLRVESGLYGQPLPDDIRFPSVPLTSARNLVYGETLTFTGYPRFGGRGSRATVTVSRGIVAGFEVVPEGMVLKTDATIGPGNSGGAAVNAAYELIGLPAEVMGLGSSGIGYIVSTDMIPPRWLLLAGAAGE